MEQIHGDGICPARVGVPIVFGNPSAHGQAWPGAKLWQGKSSCSAFCGQCWRGAQGGPSLGSGMRRRRRTLCWEQSKRRQETKLGGNQAGNITRGGKSPEHGWVNPGQCRAEVQCHCPCDCSAPRGEWAGGDSKGLMSFETCRSEQHKQKPL